MMNVMLRMQFVHLTGQNLAGMDAGFVLSGRRSKNMAVEGPAIQEDHQLTQGLRRLLFVINFDPINTRMRDLKRHFEPYGKVLNVRIRRNFAFIQFESQDDATKALEATNMSKLMDRVISVEYAVRDDDKRRNGYSSDMRGRGKSPESRSCDRGRSASPYGRGVGRASPDYGRGSSPYTKPEQRSPNYGRAESPAYERP